jgi:hypothetical protein
VIVALYASQERARERLGAIVFRAVRDASNTNPQTPHRYFMAECEDHEEADALHRLHVARWEWQQRTDDPNHTELDG